MAPVQLGPGCGPGGLLGQQAVDLGRIAHHPGRSCRRTQVRAAPAPGPRAFPSSAPGSSPGAVAAQISVRISSTVAGRALPQRDPPRERGEGRIETRPSRRRTGPLRCAARPGRRPRPRCRWHRAPTNPSAGPGAGGSGARRRRLGPPGPRSPRRLRPRSPAPRLRPGSRPPPGTNGRRWPVRSVPCPPRRRGSWLPPCGTGGRRRPPPPGAPASVARRGHPRRTLSVSSGTRLSSSTYSRPPDVMASTRGPGTKLSFRYPSERIRDGSWWPTRRAGLSSAFPSTRCRVTPAPAASEPAAASSCRSRAGPRAGRCARRPGRRPPPRCPGAVPPWSAWPPRPCRATGSGPATVSEPFTPSVIPVGFMRIVTLPAGPTYRDAA